MKVPWISKEKIAQKATAMCEAGGFFNVSKHAMIIRLQNLGLLVNKTKKRMDWEALCGDE